MLNYRATPHSATRVSPAEALMGRQLKTRLRVLPYNLIPKQPEHDMIKASDQAAKQKYKQDYDR